MKKIYAVPDINPDGGFNACSYLRVLNPLKTLQSREEIELVITEDPFQEKADMILVQRFGSRSFSMATAEKLVRFCRSRNIRLVYEIDDDLPDIPSVEESKKSMVRFLISGSDKVLVTTNKLKERFLRLNPNIAVIPNMLSYAQVEPNHTVAPHSKIVIGYMGSYTHNEDLGMIRMPLLQILKKYASEVRFELVGGATELGLLGKLENVRVIPLEGRDSYPLFWQWTKEELHWDIGLAPLKESEFTVCKSDIKYLDYTAMGCCGLFSDHPAYRNTIRTEENGLLVPNTVSDWYSAMDCAVNDSLLRARMLQNAKDDLVNRRMLEDNLELWRRELL